MSADIDKEEFFQKLEKEGIEAVRDKLALGAYKERKERLARLWLERKQEAQNEGRERKRDSWLASQTKALWWVVVLTIASIIATITLWLLSKFK